MSTENSFSEQNHDRRPRVSRLFNAIAFFGSFYTIADISATIGYNMQPANNTFEFSPDTAVFLSVIAAGVGTLVMDRVFQHYHPISQIEQAESQLTNE